MASRDFFQLPAREYLKNPRLFEMVEHRRSKQKVPVFRLVFADRNKYSPQTAQRTKEMRKAAGRVLGMHWRQIADLENFMFEEAA